MKTGKYLFVLFILFGTYFANGQKYAYVDSDYILKKMPEYQDSKEKLDKLADRWTKEIDELYATLKTKKNKTIQSFTTLYNTFRNEPRLLQTFTKL